ncbi:radical SAM protein [Perkinsela sp. CCAP 1560/4]|nr:radical SAM protein [Perkinsela sp. CCAP 1560/4]|eukprot:KNH05378.1 radical SAM protein [Perkinsela sp. CCAP 1560/4]
MIPLAFRLGFRRRCLTQAFAHPLRFCSSGEAVVPRVPCVEHNHENPTLQMDPSPSAVEIPTGNAENPAPDSSKSSETTPPYIPMPRKREISEDQLADIQKQVQEVIELVRTNPREASTSHQVGRLLQICRRTGQKTEAFTILDHAFSAGDSFEWTSEVINPAVAFLCDEGRVMEAITFLRSRELRYIKSLAFEPIVIALICTMQNTELMQIRMFAENIAVRLTARSHEAILRKYAHEHKDEAAERSLLLMHTQGKVEILTTELVETTFSAVFPATYEKVSLAFESEDAEDGLIECPRCGMKVFVSKEYPCMQFERRWNRRMWHVPFCKNPNDETESVSWACCVPPNTSKQA